MTEEKKKQEDGRRKEKRGEKRRREEYANHVSSQLSLPASQLPVLAARILTDRPYGFIMRHTHKHKPTHTMHEDAPALHKLITRHTHKHIHKHYTHRCKHSHGEEEVCDELNERSEEEDVMAR